MNILVILIPCSLFLGLLALGFFIWTVRADQYEDPAGTANRILIDGEAGPGDTGKETLS